MYEFFCFVVNIANPETACGWVARGVLDAMEKREFYTWWK
jgi:hypothetical protein